MSARSPRSQVTTVAAVLLVLATALAGCLAPPAPSNGDPPHVPPRTDPPWENPYTFPVHFDGWRAYTELLAHIYEDPDQHEGPRYRIPGTPTHATVAAELLAALRAPLETMGGTATFHNFTGSDYYALDLSPLAAHHLCAADDPARERVRGITFSNVVGRTHPDKVGLIIGAHWDTKRHVEPALDPEHEGESVLGADDGGSGTMAVIELARAFARTRVDLPLTFILFDGEDGFDRADCHPLAGSLHYAQNMSDTERESATGMILLDMVGNLTARFEREGYSQCYTLATDCAVNARWLVDHVWAVAAEMGVGAFANRTGGYILDDHVPFLHEGVHAIDIIRYERGFARYWHTTEDDHTAVHPLGLHQVGHVVEASIRLLDADPERIG